MEKMSWLKVLAATGTDFIPQEIEKLANRDFITQEIEKLANKDFIPQEIEKLISSLKKITSWPTKILSFKKLRS